MIYVQYAHALEIAGTQKGRGDVIFDSFLAPLVLLVIFTETLESNKAFGLNSDIFFEQAKLKSHLSLPLQCTDHSLFSSHVNPTKLKLTNKKCRILKNDFHQSVVVFSF
jgi:hypothetical protein